MKQIVTLDLESQPGMYYIRPAACPTGNKLQCCEAGIVRDGIFGSLACCQHTSIKAEDMTRAPDGNVYRECRHTKPDTKEVFSEDDGSSNVD